MAHSHHNHREHQVSHRRVHHILKHEPAGAKKHASGGAFSKVTSKRAAEAHEGIRMKGTKAPKRYAKGGKVTHKHTNVNIIMPQHRPPLAGSPMGGPPAGAPLPPPPMGGAPVGPPGMPPGMPPPGMPMRKRGGKVMTAGAATGVGRLEEAKAVKRRRGK